MYRQNNLVGRKLAESASCAVMTLEKGPLVHRRWSYPDGLLLYMFCFFRWTSSHVALYVIRSRADFNKKGQDMHSHELHLAKQRLSAQPLIMQMVFLLL